MPEFEFKLSKAEMLEVIDYVYDSGAYLTTDEFYPEPKEQYIRTKADFHSYVDPHGSLKLYIVRDDFLQCPFFLSPVNRKDEGLVYTISDRFGGPSILFLWFSAAGAGSSSYYPYYFYEEVDYYKQRPPEALIQLYKDIFKYVRKRTVVIKYFGRRYYCGREYIDQALRGEIEYVDDRFRVLLEELQAKENIIKLE